MASVGQQTYIFSIHDIFFVCIEDTIPSNCLHRLHDGHYIGSPGGYSCYPAVNENAKFYVDSVIAPQKRHMNPKSAVFQVTFGV